MSSFVQRFFVALIVSFLSLVNVAEAETADTTKVGIFVTSIFDLDYNNNSFSVEYWMWRLNNKREFKDYNSIEATNSKELKKLSSTIDWKDQSENQLLNRAGDTLFWDYENFRSTVKHDYDITKYPFDEEVLIMEFESSNYYDDWVKLQIDQTNSGKSNFKINGRSR